MTGALKAAYYLGALLALGGGYHLLFVARPGNRDRGRTTIAVLIAAGALVVLVVTPLELRASLQALLGQFDPWLGWEYLTATRHGDSLLWRVLVPLAAAVPFLPFPPNVRRSLFVVLAVAAVVSHSAVSHSAALAGRGGWLLDGLHLAAATAWFGAVFYLVWSCRGEGASQRLEMLSAVSRTGLVAVLVLVVTAVPLALLHVRDPETLMASDYGWLLITKSAIFAAALVLAALNRFLVMPAQRRSRGEEGGVPPAAPLTLLAEASLIAAVLVVTGLLTTTPPPHEPGASPDVLEHLRNFLSLIWR